MLSWRKRACALSAIFQEVPLLGSRDRAQRLRQRIVNQPRPILAVIAAMRNGNLGHAASKRLDSAKYRLIVRLARRQR
jgi:hypothetical protein